MDEGEAGRLGTDASRLVVAPLPVELTAARAARFAWQRRFRAARNRVSLGAIVAQSTIARNFLRGEPPRRRRRRPPYRVPVCLAIRLVVSGEIDTSGGDPTDGR